MISIIPPKLSPSSLAASILAIIFSAASSSAHLTDAIFDPFGFSEEYGGFSKSFQLIGYLGFANTPPILVTWPCISISNSSRNLFAIAPAATLAVLSLALDLSRIFRASSCMYLVIPGVSACPGRRC